MLRTPRTPWPERVDVRQQIPEARRDDDSIVITFIGHSTFLIQTAAGNIITDPVFADHAGPFGRVGPRRVRAPGVAFDDLPSISIVLLSHNHYDHCDLGALRAIEKKFAPFFITPVGNLRQLRKADAQRVVELDWWEETVAGEVTVMATPAQHFSARTPFDRNRDLWGGFVFSTPRQKVFFAGDTGYARHFTQISERCGQIDLALLPIGAYEPRWFMKPIHMNPEEAVRAHLDVNPRQSIASHFGTFQLTPEGIDEPVRALTSALQAASIPAENFRVLDTGQSFHFV